MVCAIELGLIQPPTITSSGRKPKTRERKHGWPGNRTTSEGPVPKSNDSAITGSRLMKGHEMNARLPYRRITRRIKHEVYPQDNLPFIEHRSSLPARASSFTENIDTTRARNIYYNGGKRLADKTTVYNPFNALREWSKRNSNVSKYNRRVTSQTGARYVNDLRSDDCDTTSQDSTRERIFTEYAKSTVTLRERFKCDGSKSRTIRSAKRIAPNQRYFRRKQRESTCLQANGQTRTPVEIRGERVTDTGQVSLARVRQQSSILQTLSKHDIYEFNRPIKNQSGSHDALSCSDDSPENDGQGSHNFPKERRSIDGTSLNELHTESDKKAEPSGPAKKVTRKRRYYREPVWLQANKMNRSGVKKTSKDERKKKDCNNATTKINGKIVEEEIEGRFSRYDGTSHLANSTNNYQDSEVDETLLVNPSTDLPGALFGSYDLDNEIINLNPQFDVNFDMNFEAHSMSTTLDVSHILTEDVAEDGAKLGTNIEEVSSIDENGQTEKRHSQSNSKYYWGKKLDVQKKGKESSSLTGEPRKRRSADTIVRGSNEDKENYHGNSNGGSNIYNKIGRITRGSIKNCAAAKEANGTRWAIGTVVWGHCMGWWPGLIIDAEDVGMRWSEGKSWIYWIGEYRISHLRDKTQVQSFSTGLRTRMIETLRVKTPKDANYAASLATIKLLNDRILQRGPLTKPYHAWVEKHLASHENIDQLILHPYPPNVEKRLNELKKENSAATEKYLSEVNETKSKAPKSSVKSTVPTDPGHLSLANQKPGVITWAKIMGQIWWPAMIIDFRDCGMKEPNFGCQWILWYGDYTLSQVNHRFFLAFETGMTRLKEYALNCKREVYRRGILDAAKDFCSQYGYKTDAWTLQDAFKWFSKSEYDQEPFGTPRNNILPGIPGNAGESSQKYSSRIVEGLRKHKGNCTVAAIREYNIKDSADLESVLLGKSDLKALCLMCLKNCNIEENKSMDHPFFEGALCEECAEKYIPTIFAYGEDGKCFFCTICAGSDTVVMCDEHDCSRVYCTACLKYLIAPKTYDEIMINDPFLCFSCEDSPDLLLDGLLKPRADWKTRVAGLFNGNRDSVPNQVEYYKDGKKKLRVLSLFDGISAGLVVLNKLEIQVETYYASEIDPDAEMVSSAHFGGKIIRLGDVRSITEEMIRGIAPIHLLIGGSPCNDLSLVNPMRLGLHDPNGTGILVFEYLRIKNLIKKANNETHFFWLFENVASMPGKYRLEINEHLGREPDVIDAANYSPQHRPRLYWSNLPIVSYPLSSQDLQDVLTPNCNRHALVKKIRTVTTRVNSLKQGKAGLKPILMNEENDSLWITELEEIFGFPRHYTDVKNLCATKRQKLIGKSWSIQTIAELMRPLCNFFVQTRTHHSS